MIITIEMTEKDPAVILNDYNQTTIKIGSEERYFQLTNWEHKDIYAPLSPSL